MLAFVIASVLRSGENTCSLIGKWPSWKIVGDIGDFGLACKDFRISGVNSTDNRDEEETKHLRRERGPSVFIW